VYDILIASIYIYNWLLVHQFPVLPYQMCYLYPEILLTSEKSQDVKKHESLNSKTHTHQVVFFFVNTIISTGRVECLKYDENKENPLYSF
jgi:hypothetical protein